MFLWMIAALLAYFIKGLCGFANSLIFSSILSFGTNNINITPVDVLLGYPTNMIMAWKGRKEIDWKVSLPLAFLVLLGNIPGIFLLKAGNAQIIKIFFGFVIIGIGIEMFFRERGMKKIKSSKWVLGVIGLLSGLLCGLYGIGALLAAYVSRVTDNSREFKANMCVVFTIENTFRVILYVCMGILTTEVIKQVLIVVPFMLIGLFAGMKSSSLLDEKMVKKAVIIMLIFSGAALVINNM